MYKYIKTMEYTTEKAVTSKTFDEIVEFSNEAYKFISKAEEEGKANTKLIYALKRIAGDPVTQKKGTLHKVIRKGQIKSRDLQIDYASVDDRGNLIKDDKGQYSYTKENKKALDLALENLTNDNMEFEPYIATEVTEDLNEYQKDLFKGFVIN